MGEGLAYVDGKYCPPGEARMSVMDPGFTHCDVVYDVTSTWKDNFFRLDEHIERFLASCAGIHLVCPYGPKELKRILATCVAQGGVGEASYVSMALTRGAYTAEGKKNWDLSKTTPNFIAYAIPYVWIADLDKQQRGMSMIVAKTPRIPDVCVDMRFKNFHWGDLIRAKFEATAAGVDSAVLLTLDGFLTEGAGYNIFFIKDGRLFTPARNCLQGVTRRSVLELAAQIGVPAEAGDYPADELRNADEAFITSTAGGVMPVSKIDGRALGSVVPGALTVRLKDEYWRRRNEGWLGTPVGSLMD
jgi:branched-chain amino acid aminotransferase